MEIDEVITRLTRRYWYILLIAIAAPIVAVGMIVHRQAPHYTASARIVVAAEVPKSAAEASALVSQIDALATSHDQVLKALVAGHVANRDPGTIADHHVSVTGNGTSAIVTISVTDNDPIVAQTVAQKLAQGVGADYDTAKSGNLPNVIAQVDNQLNTLATRRAPIAAQAAAIEETRKPDPTLPMLQSQLVGIDTLISDLSSDRNRLSEQLAAAGSTSVVSSAQLPTRADPKGAAQKMALGGVLGLVVGMILAAAAETVHPTVSGAARLGRLLHVPLLGRLDANPAVLHALGRRVRLAARRAGVSQIVVTSALGRPVPEWVVDRLGSVVLAPLGSLRTAPVEEPALASIALNGGHMDGSGPGADPLETSIGVYDVGTLEELSPAAEGGPVGVLVLAGGSTNANAIHEIRDLLAASGWPLLGVIRHARWGNRR